MNNIYNLNADEIEESIESTNNHNVNYVYINSQYQPHIHRHNHSHEHDPFMWVEEADKSAIYLHSIYNINRAIPDIAFVFENGLYTFQIWVCEGMVNHTRLIEYLEEFYIDIKNARQNNNTKKIDGIEYIGYEKIRIPKSKTIIDAQNKILEILHKQDIITAIFDNL